MSIGGYQSKHAQLLRRKDMGVLMLNKQLNKQKKKDLDTDQTHDRTRHKRTGPWMPGKTRTGWIRPGRYGQAT